MISDEPWSLDDLRDWAHRIMINDDPWSLEDMRDWAHRQTVRKPDVLIGPKETPYMRRWWMIPRNQGGQVYLHEILRSDDDRALHDHPWDSTSYVLEGGYVEHLPGGDQVWRGPGSIVQRRAEDLHRLEIIDGNPALSLFITGPKVREWGFQCGERWVHWREYTSPLDKGLIGRGCGEP